MTQNGSTVPSTGARRIRSDDPFFDDDRFSPTVKDDTMIPEPHPESSSSLEAFIMMPLQAVTFIMSLHFIDTNYRSWRVWHHVPRKISIWTWSAPEPYQVAQDTTWNVAPSSDPAPASSWHMHGKVRKLAKKEIGDALEIRGQVLAFGVFWLAISTACTFALLKHVYIWFTQLSATAPAVSSH